MLCPQCGQPAVGPFCAHCGHAISVALAPPAEQSRNVLIWPFQEQGWPSSLWMTFAWLLPLGQLVTFGWSVEALGRRARSQSPLLPQSRDLARILFYGLVIVVVWVVYFLIPVSVMVWLFNLSWLQVAWQFFVLLWDAFLHRPHESLALFLTGRVLQELSNSAAPLVYLAIATPLFLAGWVRFAVTGHWWSFLRFVSNGLFCLRHIGDVLLYLFLSAALRTAMLLLSSVVMAIPVLGQLAAITLSSAAVWIRVGIATPLAAKMLAHATRRESTAQSTSLATGE